MPSYIVERNFPEQVDPDSLDRPAIKRVNDETGVRWLHSFLSADRRKSYCLCEAPTVEALREAAARAGMPADVVVEVDQVPGDQA